MPALSSPFDSNISLTREPLTSLQINNGKSRANKWNPKPHEENPFCQEGLNSISIRDPLRAALVMRDKVKVATSKTFIVTKDEYELYKDPVRLAESYRNLIQDHVATRVALFFQQAIVCYKTPFHFEVGDTEGQIFEAKTLKIKTEADPELKISYQAAHSSTIPSLKACPISNYQEAQAKGETPKYFSFLGDSYMETLDNSTMGLPIFVNQIDTLLDGNSKSEDALRLDTIRLINKLAAGKITPCKATREFLTCFLRQLKERPAASQTLTPAKQKTISIYEEKVKEIIGLAETPEDLEQARDVPDARKIEELRRTPISASTISRLENSRIHILKNFKTDENQRRKYLTLYQTKIISKALQVDSGHYFCAFFASESVER